MRNTVRFYDNHGYMMHEVIVTNDVDALRLDWMGGKKRQIHTATGKVLLINLADVSSIVIKEGI